MYQPHVSVESETTWYCSLEQLKKNLFCNEIEGEKNKADGRNRILVVWHENDLPWDVLNVNRHCVIYAESHVTLCRDIDKRFIVRARALEKQRAKRRREVIDERLFRG